MKKQRNKNIDKHKNSWHNLETVSEDGNTQSTSLIPKLVHSCVYKLISTVYYVDFM